MEDVEVSEENLLPNVSGLKVNKQHHCYYKYIFCFQIVHFLFFVYNLTVYHVKYVIVFNL